MLREIGRHTFQYFSKFHKLIADTIVKKLLIFINSMDAKFISIFFHETPFISSNRCKAQKFFFVTITTRRTLNQCQTFSSTELRYLSHPNASARQSWRALKKLLFEVQDLWLTIALFSQTASDGAFEQEKCLDSAHSYSTWLP